MGRSFGLAAVVMTAIVLWWSAALRLHFKADFTRLFLVGDDWEMPPELDALAPAKVPGTGYDGQWYLLMTIDPFLTKRFDLKMDDGRLRYRRILVPLLAHFAAGGVVTRAPVAFGFVTVLFIGLGVYWCSQFALSLDRSYLWGWAFALLPGLLAAVDRMGVDAAMAALTMGLCHYVRQKSRWRLFLVLVLVGLTRETGLLLIAAVAFSCFCAKDWGKLIPAGVSALPAFAWFCYVASITAPSDNPFAFDYPFSVVVRAIANPELYPNTGWILALVQGWDVASIVAIISIMSLALVRFRCDAPGCAAALFALSGIYLASGKEPTVFVDVFAYGRAFAPLFVLALARSMESSNWQTLALSGVISLRIAMFFVAPFLTIIHSLLR